MFLKNYILFSLITIIGFAANGQSTKGSTYRSNTFLVSTGGRIGLPVGRNNKPFSHNFGGDLQAEFKPSEIWAVTFNIAYISDVKKDIKVNGVIEYSGSISFITAMGGIKYTFTNDFFLHAQLGFGHSGSIIGNKICYGTGIGYDFSRNIDLELNHLGIKGAGYTGGALNTINLRLGYNF